MNAIEVSHVKKKFKVYYDKGRSLKERLLFRNRNHYEDRWVLKDVSFTVAQGEAIGIIGKNGCGKSTMLKLLTKIMYPDEGQIKMHGRVASLIELGAGFHPDMSGRENIYTNASIFGLTRKEIETRLQTIINFSELWEFIDNPVRTYSSGMYMRLAFAVAINVDADILLIDEILAVGDANFQAKCFNRLREIKAAGTTIVIVSHDMASIERLCDREIWLKDGLMTKQGTPREVSAEYMDSIMNNGGFCTLEQVVEQAEESSEKNTDSIVETNNELGNRFVSFTNIKMEQSRSETAMVFRTGDAVTVKLTYSRNKNTIEDAAFGIRIYRTDGVDCYGTNTIIDNGNTVPLKDTGTVVLHLKSIPFLDGEYSVDVAVHSADGQTYHHISNACMFQIYSPIKEVGLVHVDHDWWF